MFRVAFTSRSSVAPQSVQIHSWTESGYSGRRAPQREQVFEDGKNRPHERTWRPDRAALSPICRRNSDQEASLMLFERHGFFGRLQTARTWFSFASRVESLWRKSSSGPPPWRESGQLSGGPSAGSSFSFFRASLRSQKASRFSSCRKKLGASIFSPLERVAKDDSPRSIPTLVSIAGFGTTSSEKRRETKQRPAGPFVTQTEDTFAPWENTGNSGCREAPSSWPGRAAAPKGRTRWS